MRNLTYGAIAISMLLSAAIFGFFYAWVVSTMWGLDAADPRTAIAAMQAMNASVRNAVFAPAFFATPFALALTGQLLRMQGARASANAFLAAGAVYFIFGLMLTMLVNVPMNEALAATDIPVSRDAAHEVWSGYSGKWQFWNQARTVASGLSFCIALWGVMMLPDGLKLSLVE